MTFLKRREVIIPILILACAALPYKLEPKMLILGMVAIAGAVGALLLLKSPPLSLLLLVPGTFLVRFEIGTGTQTGINTAVLLVLMALGLWLFDMVVVQKQVTFILSRTLLPLFGLLAMATISFFVGQLRLFPVSGAPIRAQIGGLAVFYLTAFAYIVMPNRIQSSIWLERFTWLYLAVGAVHFFGYNLSYLVSSQAANLAGRILAPRADGSLFWVWMISMAFGQLIHNSRLKWSVRFLLVALIGIMFYNRFIMAREWTSGWAPMVVSVAVITALKIKREWVPIIAVGVALVALVGIPIAIGLAMENNDYSASTRLEAWKVLFEMIRVSPLFGFGPANYYWYTPLFNIMGYYVRFNSHNNYVDLIAQTGLVGLAFYGWFMVEVFLQSWRLRSKVSSGFLTAYINACLGGLAGTVFAGMLGDWVIPFVYNIGMSGFRASAFGFALMGGLVFIEDMLSRKSTAQGN